MSYVAFSVPAIAACIAATYVGLQRSTTWYGVAVIVMIVAAATASFLRRERPVAALPPQCAACPGTVAPHPQTASRG